MTSLAVKGWLLDTHALLWMLYGDKRLSKKAKEAIDGNFLIYYSTVSFWEVALKLSRKGFDFEIEDDWDQIYPQELQRVGLLSITPNIADYRVLQDLPKHHGDPFDRILVCQALRHNLGIVSADVIMDEYGIKRAW